MFTLRPVVESDLPALLELIRELAEYEKLEHKVCAREADLRLALFGERPLAEAIFAEARGAVAGFALYFTTFSTFAGTAGIYLEDLYVRPDFRRLGIGRACFRYLAQVAVERNYGRIAWSVLDWNASAIAFYEDLGAEMMRDWRTMRLGFAELQALAASGAADCK